MKVCLFAVFLFALWVGAGAPRRKRKAPAPLRAVTISPAPEPLPAEDFKRQEAALDAEHWREVVGQLEELRGTITAEIDAIKATRDKMRRLAELQDFPAAYVDLAASIERRDYSERREAALQRQLITVSNQIYAAQKRIIKAERIVSGLDKPRGIK